MATSFTICIPSISSCIRRRSSTAEQEEVLQIVKMDGKVLEFNSPVLVKDVLVNVSGLGIGLSRQASHHLPPNYQLKLGKVYYTLPSTEASNHAAEPAATTGVVKRIKVVITKQQLEQLLSKQISVGEVLSVLQTPTNWKPKLESIPEGTE
ncbi:hypothetical protein OWV82_005395 [Melia azedarach]|uniref:Uncharacterized protein n=1 Tax=Melia azedarach TaxID=155640 RepID=A0ACC1YSD5_MELAZ|nr:hypothetical protein OWV82_005395 [Melia azedarach]